MCATPETLRRGGPARTLGPRSAALVDTLRARGRCVFTPADVSALAGLGPAAARNLAAAMAGRGVAARLDHGLFGLAPPFAELPAHGSPGLAARFQIGLALARRPGACIAFDSAMTWHDGLPDADTITVVCCPRFATRSILGRRYRAVRGGHDDGRGIVTAAGRDGLHLRISGLERTVLDALNRPDLCGGLTVAAAFLRRHLAGIDGVSLVNQALDGGRGGVIRRLGYLLERLDGAPAPGDTGALPSGWSEQLRAGLTPAYGRLYPTLPARGRYCARWRLRLNVDPAALAAALGAAEERIRAVPAGDAARASAVPSRRRLAGFCLRHRIHHLTWMALPPDSPPSAEGPLVFHIVFEADAGNRPPLTLLEAELCRLLDRAVRLLDHRGLIRWLRDAIRRNGMTLFHNVRSRPSRAGAVGEIGSGEVGELGSDAAGEIGAEAWPREPAK